jgi:hypothetical protein
MNIYKVKTFQPSQLDRAMNCLIYGVRCLYYNKFEGTISECIIHIHD